MKKRIISIRDETIAQEAFDEILKIIDKYDLTRQEVVYICEVIKFSVLEEIEDVDEDEL